MTSQMTGRVALVIIVVSALIIMLLGWFAFIGPQRSKASDLAVQIASTETQILDAQQLLRGPTKKQSLAAVHQLQGVMPDQIKMSQLLRQLSSVAATSQTELDTITPSAPTATSGPEAIPMAVKVTGRYFALQSFLRLLRASADVRNGKLAASGRLFTVDSIDFTGGQVGGVVTANLKINAFLYTTPAAVAPVATTPTSTTATAAGP